MELEVLDLLKKAHEIRKQSGVTEKGFSIDSKKDFREFYDLLKKEGFNTSLFVENLKTLELHKLNEETMNEINSGSISVPAFYDSKQNKIVYSDWNDLGHELAHVASSKRSSLTGIEFINNEGKKCATSLNEGISDYLTKIIDKNYILRYPLQEYIIEILIGIYGTEILNPYFYADGKWFFNQFNENKQIILEIINYLDEYKKIYETILISLQNKKIENYDYDKLKNIIRQVILKLKAIAYLSNKIDMNNFNSYFIELFKQPEMNIINAIVTNFSISDFIIDDNIKIKYDYNIIENKSEEKNKN